ncbi:hypothetical protein ONZ45_g14702 [Pleurotus djamor]|nr:hypothetical protein ONZ45_g14702 [Pleurotus djamor]
MIDPLLGQAQILPSAPTSFETQVQVRMPMLWKDFTRLGQSWRSSYWFVTIVVGFGIFVDILVYSILVPVSPFYLSHKGYNAPALVGWLLTAYSLGLVACTLPLAIFSKRFNSGKWPFVVGLLVLVASQILFWVSSSYVAMIVARIIQGIGSALVWIIGLALVCDYSPPEVVGRQLGVAMSGLASGSVLGPPLGSLLYDRFGMVGPLTFGASVVGLDLIGRLLIIERHEDTISSTRISHESERRQGPGDAKVELYPSLRIMKRMAESPRLMCSLGLELFGFGMVNTMIDTGLPLRLKDDYGSTITQVAPPIGGYLSDKFGTERTILLGVGLSIPWWPLLLIHMKVGWLITVYAFGHIHVYAMSILAYGIGSIIGPIVAGQLYAHFHNLGWTSICVAVAGIPGVSYVPDARCTMEAHPRLGHNWRSSYLFVTTVVGFGIFADNLVYTILIPVAPFYLSHKGYDNAPALVGWLYTAFSLGQISGTLPLAILSEKTHSRKWPLVAGLLVLVASQFLFWEAPSYPLMVISRVIQGVSLNFVWIFGCDSSPPEVVGRQLGFAISGFGLGALIGPPLGSLLYDHFGAAGPLTLGVSVAGLDLIGRFLVVERRVDAASICETPETTERQQSLVDKIEDKVKSYTFIQIMKQIGGSPRLLCSYALELFVFGMLLSMIETSLPLRLKDDHNLTTTQVGLFLLAGGGPAFVAPPLGGYLSDKFGAEWIIPLGWLVAVFAIDRFIAASVYASSSAEMARASKEIEGVQYTHVYAVWLVAYGIGSVVGPMLAGQLYAHLHNLGWSTICVVIASTRWRSSYWFVTIVVGFGIFVDILVYTILIPVSPFYLNHKGYDAPALVGWLFTAYSFGLVSSSSSSFPDSRVLNISVSGTIPLAKFSAGFTSLKWPLVVGMLLLIASQIMFWEAPSYLTMIIANDTRHQRSFGVDCWVSIDMSFLTPGSCQLGFAMSGYALGSVLGPPLGSLLYDRYGVVGPLTLGASVSGLDLIGRLLIIEPSTKNGPEIIEFQQNPDDGKVNVYSLIQIMKQIWGSPRLICSCCLDLFAFGMVISMMETGLPLRLKDDHALTTAQVGLFLLAGGAPSFVAPPIAGYLTDKFGPEWTIPICLALSIPSWLLLYLHMKLSVLITFYAIGRFTSVDTHVYAMSNFAFGTGAIVGPILSGQLYANFHNLGWTIICIVIAGTRLLIIPFLFLWTGDVPLRKRLQKAIASSGDSKL